MAGITGVGCWHVIATLTTRPDTVVTANAIAHETCVIRRGHLSPANCIMTIVAFQRCLCMAWAFTLRRHVVMTAGAHTEDFIMIHRAIRHWRPGRWTRLMTRITSVSGVDMVRPFARCHYAIVTTRAAADNLRVIHRA
jgi:hypothetical protein